jgi:hypothetical protein
MTRWAIAVLAAGVGLVAAAARAGGAEVVNAPTVFASRTLPSSAVTSFAVKCPPGHVATSGGVSSPPAGAGVLRIAPTGVGTYAFRLTNPTARPKRVGVAVTCRKVEAGPRLTVRHVQTTFRVGSDSQRSARLACPSRTTAAGWGVDVDGTALELRVASATLRGFRFTLHNTRSRARRATVYGNCVTVLRSAGAAPAPLRVKITTWTDAVVLSRQHYRHRCPSGWFSLGAGFAVGRPSLHLAGAAAVQGGGSWWVTHDASDQARVQLQLSCGRLG